MSEAVQHAFKEWAVIVEALGSGEQTLILRKGGIHEGRQGFGLRWSEFLLFPTYHHQQRDAVIPAAQPACDRLAATVLDPAKVKIQWLARVAAWKRLETLAEAERLRGRHLWRDEVVASRWAWGRETGLHAVIVRVHRLAIAHTLPVLPAYGGCRSWVELAIDLPVEDARPVLSDGEFAGRMRDFRALLEGPWQVP